MILLYGVAQVSTGYSKLNKHAVDVNELLKNHLQPIKFNKNEVACAA